ncbi:MAG TPA: SRPBCC family protein [Alphaproteobacteria bacterium]|nr:SRPBCC family protein [Alphaproteobacteria bacterium]
MARQPGAFERLSPPWGPVEVRQRCGGIEDGDRLTLAISVGPLSLRWTLEHRNYQAGRQFRDVQLTGPFAHWEHSHRFEPDGPESCYLEDRIQYSLPLGALGRRLGGGYLQRKLERYSTSDIVSRRKISRPSGGVEGEEVRP